MRIFKYINLPVYQIQQWVQFLPKVASLNKRLDINVLSEERNERTKKQNIKKAKERWKVLTSPFTLMLSLARENSFSFSSSLVECDWLSTCCRFNLSCTCSWVTTDWLRGERRERRDGGQEGRERGQGDGGEGTVWSILASDSPISRWWAEVAMLQRR